MAPASAALTADDLPAFQRDGFIIRRALFDAEEVALLDAAITGDPAMAAHIYARADGSGGVAETVLWTEAGDDLLGRVARSRRIVDSMELLLGGEVYHYHSKSTSKRPRLGGTWEWHQDYGYWYDQGCLFPALASVYIAVSAATRENGCLEMIAGSQAMGRLDHGATGAQTGADPVRVAEALKRLRHVHVELAPGDAVFFHCLTLHGSGPNSSDRARNNLLCCYNAAYNSPIVAGPLPGYAPLVKCEDDAVRSGASAPRRRFYRPTQNIGKSDTSP